MNLFKVISPADNSVVAERHYARPSKVERALILAQKAQKNWRKTPLRERARICRKALDYFLENKTEIAEELTRQMGRPIRYAPFEISGGMKERAEYMINIAEKALADVPVGEKEGFRRFIRREPVGTVFVLAPWNYPYLTSVNAIIPALMAGNVVILKHARQTPLCAERYAAAFEYAGLPEGVFQYLHLTHEQVGAVLKDDRIQYVTFTGSVSGGAAVTRALAGRFAGTGLELGGKDPAYIRADAPLDFAVENLVDGAFFNSGQSCCGVERIYVHESVCDRFVEGFVELTRQYRLGNPLDPATTLGPMVRAEAARFAQKQIDQAIALGAKTRIDPADFPAHVPGTPYFAPQVLVGVNHKMEIMREESFAPVVGIMPVKNDEEAVFWMNDSLYGLTASVWTSDPEKAIEIGDQLETGTCFMNRCDYLDPALAWTGVKNSGRGCALSALGYEPLTRPKSFHLRMP
ncbi:MAG: aldehyde dehydrogenase family protein [Bacteroidetes bacterium]|nr:MAG: aldehyde dehydrogenase family protein [Bacteroidota bacterium]